MTKKIIFIFCLVSLSASLVLIPSQSLFAQGVGVGVGDDLGGDKTEEGVSAQSSTKLRNPLGTTSIPRLLGRIINALLGIVGSIALLMFVYGGFMWLTSGGSSEKVKRGWDIIIWTSIGLVVIFVSYVLVGLVINTLTGISDEGNEEYVCICSGEGVVELNQSICEGRTGCMWTVEVSDKESSF